MMKKLLPITAIALGTLMSSQAHAAIGDFSGGSTDMSPANCPALDNNITITLSKNVAAVYNCDDTSFQAATCHEAGTDKTQTLECLYDNSKNPLPGYDTCAAWADPAPTIVINGRVGFRGASGGGRVTAAPLNGDCLTTDTTDLKTLVPDFYLDSQTSSSTDIQ